MKRAQQRTKQELNLDARQYAGHLIRLVHKCRVGKGRYWDIPRVVVACASLKSPFILKHAHSCESVKHPHSTLSSSYPSQRNEPGMPKYPREAHFPEGHCAEPHAAHKLLNAMDKARQPIQISDILFGSAISVINGTVKPYCATCKQTFPQLR